MDQKLEKLLQQAEERKRLAVLRDDLMNKVMRSGETYQVISPYRERKNAPEFKLLVEESLAFVYLPNDGSHAQCYERC